MILRAKDEMDKNRRKGLRHILFSLSESISRFQRLRLDEDIFSWGDAPGFYIPRLWRFLAKTLVTSRETAGLAVL
jgi:hypothetical protein